jgi:hypothetical protein
MMVVIAFSETSAWVDRYTDPPRPIWGIGGLLFLAVPDMLVLVALGGRAARRCGLANVAFPAPSDPTA